MEPSTELPVHHRPGAKALVQIATPRSRRIFTGPDFGEEFEYFECTVVQTVSADDRPYRLIVKLHHTTRDIGPCAPECVVPTSTLP